MAIPSPEKKEDKDPTFLDASAKTSSTAQSAPEVGTRAVARPAASATVNTTIPSQMVPAGELSVMEVLFRFGTADLATNDDQATLITVRRLTKLIPDARVVIKGYTGQVGSQRYNLLLSKKRALIIVANLKNWALPRKEF